MGRKNEDFRIPDGLAKQLIKEYSGCIWYDEDTRNICYEETLDAFAEQILEDYDEKKMEKNFGYVMYDQDKISNWLHDNLPELYEELLVFNKEL